MSYVELEKLITRTEYHIETWKQQYLHLLCELKKSIETELEELANHPDQMPRTSINGVPIPLWGVEKIQDACTKMNQQAELLGHLRYIRESNSR